MKSIRASAESLLMSLLACVIVSACGAEDGRVPVPSQPADSGRVDVDSSAPSQTTTEMFNPGVNPDSVDLRDRFIVLGLRRLGGSIGELSSTLGAPDSIASEPIQNRHEPSKTDSIVTAHFKGVRAIAYRPQDGGDLIASITVYDNSLLRLNTVEIGMEWKDVLSTLGQPDYTEGAESRWSCAQCVVDHELVIETRNGRVWSIGFAYYVD